MLKLALISLVLVSSVYAAEKAPEFALRNQEGKTVKLSELAGKPVLIFFYPKDETPGCTKEACTIRDTFQEFQRKGAVVLGVSTQDEKSHQQFKAKHKLPFDLLVDNDGKMAASYGVKMIPGTALLERKSILIGPDGTIAKRYEQVDPTSHAKEVLADLSALTGKKS